MYQHSMLKRHKLESTRDTHELIVKTAGFTSLCSCNKSLTKLNHLLVNKMQCKMDKSWRL